MHTSADQTIRRRDDGSIDIGHYAALGRAARAEQAELLARAIFRTSATHSARYSLLDRVEQWFGRRHRQSG